MYIFHEQNTAFCLYIKHFHCIRFHLAFRISFTNICLYTLDFYVNHENTILIYSYLSFKNNNKQKETILDAYTRMVFLIYDKIGKKEVNL